jgi:hypothetical protein
MHGWTATHALKYIEVKWKFKTRFHLLVIFLIWTCMPEDMVDKERGPCGMLVGVGLQEFEDITSHHLEHMSTVLVRRPPSNTSGILVDKEPPFPWRSRIEAHSQKLTRSWRSISLYVRVSDVFCSGFESRNTSSVLECKLCTTLIHYVQYQGVVGAFRSFTKYILWIHREKSPDGGEREREGVVGSEHLVHGVYRVSCKPAKRQTSILKR